VIKFQVLERKEQHCCYVRNMDIEKVYDINYKNIVVINVKPSAMYVYACLDPVVISTCVFGHGGQRDLFIVYGTRISASTSGAGKCNLTPPCKTIACDDVTISRALHLYKIAFILLGSSLKQ